MNETEINLLTKEKLLEMYEEALLQLEFAEAKMYSQDSEINELQSDVEYWRDAYYNLKEHGYCEVYERKQDND